MSTELQVFFDAPPSGVTAKYRQASVPQNEVDAQISATRMKAAEDLRQQYEAQLSDMRTEAVEFHQHLVSSIEDALGRWKARWEEQVPALVFAGVHSVLSDFELSDEQLHAWVKRTFDECGAKDKGTLEVRLSPKNVHRLQAFWKEQEITVPETCVLHAAKECSDVDCRIVGRRGILDASLPVRLSQLRRLWSLNP